MSAPKSGARDGTGCEFFILTGKHSADVAMIVWVGCLDFVMYLEFERFGVCVKILPILGICGRLA